MPVKRRLPKHWIDPVAELEAWSGPFGCGHDIFGDLVAFGFPHGSGAATQAAAREAWERLGGAFLETWKPDPHRPIPWAQATFGLPKGGR